MVETVAAGGRKWNSEREVLSERHPDAWTDEFKDTTGKGWWRSTVCIRRTGVWQGVH